MSSKTGQFCSYQAYIHITGPLQRKDKNREMAGNANLGDITLEEAYDCEVVVRFFDFG
jgi:hypothetical protein